MWRASTKGIHLLAPAGAKSCEYNSPSAKKNPLAKCKTDRNSFLLPPLDGRARVGYTYPVWKRGGIWMEIIARIENGFREKFGVPRQSGLVPEVISRVVMAEKYSVREAFRGIEDYSHLWLLWEFDRAQQDDWRPTVRPPRLGGNTRLGVFATRSPFRPNRIGLTVVRLIRMEEENGRITLVVSGADLMDGTPIVDIKPYLPYVDSVPDAVGGFTEQTERHRLTVDFPEKLKKYVPKQNLPAVMGLLAQDPRPAYQHDGKRVYGVPYGEVDIRFVVEGDTLTVVEVVPYTEKEQEK